MENEIIIDGEVYVKKSTIPAPQAVPGEMHLIHPRVLMDEADVLGIGSVVLKGDWIAVRVSTEYLDKVICALRACSISKDGLSAIDLIWTKDQPIVIGRLDKARREASGFIIAPQIDND